MGWERERERERELLFILGCSSSFCSLVVEPRSASLVVHRKSALLVLYTKSALLVLYRKGALLVLYRKIALLVLYRKSALLVLYRNSALLVLYKRVLCYMLFPAHAISCLPCCRRRAESQAKASHSHCLAAPPACLVCTPCRDGVRRANMYAVIRYYYPSDNNAGFSP